MCLHVYVLYLYLITTYLPLVRLDILYSFSLNEQLFYHRQSPYAIYVMLRDDTRTKPWILRRRTANKRIEYLSKIVAAISRVELEVYKRSGVMNGGADESSEKFKRLDVVNLPYGDGGFRFQRVIGFLFQGCC